jgi:hypothetical protein
MAPLGLPTRQRMCPNLARSISTFQYVRRTRFDVPARRWRRADAFTSSREWLSSLNKRGARGLWLVIPQATPGPLEPHLVAGFSNGGDWGLLAAGAGPTLWLPSWEVVDRDAPDNRIWSVRFAGSRVDSNTAPPRPSVTAALTNLITALVDIREFARDHSLGSWADRFSDAIDRAYAEMPDIPYHPDLAPPSVLSGDATCLLATASGSWVFGGMGSWNDLWLDDSAASERLQQVTRNLYRQLLGALVAGTNADLAAG